MRLIFSLRARLSHFFLKNWKGLLECEYEYEYEGGKVSRTLRIGLELVTVGLNCRNNEGPTILVIKDKEDYIYGGYASQPWEKHGDFYGHLKSFLFQMYPKASMFRPTGANHNIQWVS